MLRNESVSEQLDDAFDYASWVCTTGIGYDGVPTEESINCKMDFMKNFPEHQNKSFHMLQNISQQEKEEIVDWFFSGPWVKEEI